MKHKSYMDIKVASPATINGFEVGDHIVIQTKVDGANAAIRYDAETDSIVAQSRKNILNTSNTLRGFYEFTQLLVKDRIKAVLRPEYIIYGEWLVPHTVKYPELAYNKFYVYDIYDTERNNWAPQEYVEEIAKLLHLPYIKTWYDGEFISWEHCKSFLPNSAYGEVEQEGIVVKNMTKLNSLDNHEPFYVKIVNTRFKEKMERKEKKSQSPEQIAFEEEENNKTKTIVTPARVEKLLNKLVDEGIIPETWGATHMATIARNIPKNVVQDCIKEEPEIVATIDNFGKRANSITMKIVKDILFKREDVI
jgi:hypothetical protein